MEGLFPLSSSMTDQNVFIIIIDNFQEFQSYNSFYWNIMYYFKIVVKFEYISTKFLP